MGIIRNIFWVAFFLAATFGFIVLFEHGPSNFVENAKKESVQLQVILGIASKDSAKKDGLKPL
jgi:hypothetical protein